MFLPKWPIVNEKIPSSDSWRIENVYFASEKIGNPHKKLPPVFHIAGSNGKGSTQAFLKSLLEQAGYKVHAYTSPHLIHFNERIYLAGQNISDEYAEDLLERVRVASEGIELSFFSAITAAAFLAFSEVDADFLILETGLGGRLDATNIIDAPLASVITPISLDHTQILGNTLLEIASEKAGIIKPDSKVIVSKQNEGVIRFLEEHSKKLRCEYHIADQNIDYELGLCGDYQKINAATALKTLQVSGINLKLNHIVDGLKNAKISGRLQRISSGNLYNKLINGSELYIDGSHNVAGAEVTSNFLNSLPSMQTFIILGMMEDKDYQGFILKIASSVDEGIAVNVSLGRNSRSPEELVQFANSSSIPFSLAESISKAFNLLPKKQIRVIITGSLYLAAEALKENSGDYYE
jgi:dihydrofolate synthase / folylpolyglutamate synthase